MIKEIDKTHICECAEVIQKSFITVAEEFNITKENAPNYVAFSTNSKKLKKQLDDGRLIYAYFDNDRIIGCYSLVINDNECEINNLCVLPECRHSGIGKNLLEHVFKTAEECGCKKIKISIVEENEKLKKWYKKFGFITTHTIKYDFFPFTCGYMEKTFSAKNN